MAKVIVVGSLNMDTVAKLERLPRPGETLHSHDLQKHTGGKGANQATALARLGEQVSMIGRVGADEDGRILRQRLEAEGVDSSRVEPGDQLGTGVALIFVDRNGDNQIVVYPGANRAVDRPFVDRHLDAVSAASFLLMQFEIPMETVAYLANFAAGKGIPVVINPSPFYPIEDSLLHKIDTLVLNETEASSLLGREIQSVDEALAGAAEIREKGVRQVVLTLGEHGAVACGPGGAAEHVPAYPVQAVDATASGDAFLAGLVHALREKMSLPQAVRFANAVGALTVTKMGAQSSLPSLRQVEEFIRECSLI